MQLQSVKITLLAGMSFSYESIGPQTILLLQTLKLIVEARRRERALREAPLTLSIPLLGLGLLTNVHIDLTIDRLKRYITLSFTFRFDIPNDTVEFAYFIPYTYSRLLKFLSTVKNCKMLPPLKSLSGLGIPILEVTDE